MSDDNGEYLGANLENARAFIAGEIVKMLHDKVSHLADTSSETSDELLAAYLKLYPNKAVNDLDVGLHASRFKELAAKMVSGVPSQAEAKPELESKSVAPLTPATHDWFLQDLVGLANYFKLNPPLSLNVGGATVAGDLISAADYFKGMADTLKDSFSHNNELADSLHAMASKNAHEMTDADDYADRTPPNYIHLSNVRTFAPGRPQFAVQSKLWRGRIAEVSGFSYGTPTVQEPK